MGRRRVYRVGTMDKHCLLYAAARVQLRVHWVGMHYASVTGALSCRSGNMQCYDTATHVVMHVHVHATTCSCCPMLAIPSRHHMICYLFYRAHASSILHGVCCRWRLSSRCRWCSECMRCVTSTQTHKRCWLHMCGR